LPPCPALIGGVFFYLTGWPVLSHIISQAAGLAGRTYYGNSKMENLNFDNDSIIDPKDEAIAGLRRQLDEVNRRDQFKAEQLDQLSDAIMALIGDKVEALAEAKADAAVDGAIRDFNIDFNIYDHQSEIEDMIDDRLPDQIDEVDQREAVESIVKEVLEGATLRIETI